MKKLIALLAILTLSLCLFACGGDGDKEDPNKNPPDGGDITVNPDGSIDLPLIDITWD